jgi:micrococcal nuclease
MNNVNDLIKGCFIVVLSTMTILTQPLFGQTKPDVVSCKIVKVLDGDTYVVEKADKTQFKVRLLHIDCPEKDQPFGKEATNYAKERIEGHQVLIVIKDYDQYGRALALVVEENGTIFNFELITFGYAWQYVKYSEDVSASILQEFAMNSKMGIWSTPGAIAPWEWRKNH